MVMCQVKKKYVDIIAVAVQSLNVDACDCSRCWLLSSIIFSSSKESASVSPVKTTFLNNTFPLSNVQDDRSNKRQRRGRT